MARKLRDVGFDKILDYIDQNRKQIKRLIANNVRLEYARIFGKAYYLFAIKNFIEKYHINEKVDYAIKTINIFTSPNFINMLYNLLSLEKLEDKIITSKLSDKSLVSYKKSVLYAFVYFLFNDKNIKKASEIQERIFGKFFLHHYFSINFGNNTESNYIDMVKFLLKKNMKYLKESYSINNQEDKDIVVFKLKYKNKKIVELEGKSVKTLRKKAYKKFLYSLLDNQDIFLKK